MFHDVVVYKDGQLPTGGVAAVDLQNSSSGFTSLTLTPVKILSRSWTL